MYRVTEIINCVDFSPEIVEAKKINLTDLLKGEKLKKEKEEEIVKEGSKERKRKRKEKEKE